MLATDVARTILEGFDKHYRLFRETSTRAKERFEDADWTATRNAWQARIDMYDQRVEESVAALQQEFPSARTDEAEWPKIKAAYTGLLYGRDHKQPECAETFFNSVARRVLDRRYYNNKHIFARSAISTEHLDGDEPTYDCYYPKEYELRSTFSEILDSFRLKSPFQDVGRDLDYLIRAVEEHFPQDWHRRPNFQIHVLRSLFFRNKSAYVVGRILNGEVTVPFVVPLLKDDAGRIYCDAILLDQKNLGRLFSLGRAYFMVDMEVPSAYVEFLATVVPTKPKAELYTMIGLQKQGKTVFFRDMQRHLRHSTDAFVIAPGVKGMVMLVFTLPSFPYVFKVIRDWFEAPKDADRAHVEERYDYVKHHDRVGRMADTLEYTFVAFPRSRIDPALLRDLETYAPSMLEHHEDSVVIKHLYTERRLVPLDVFLHGADEKKLRAGVLEYGNAVKDLASADIFPGDLLLKNFGVTRHGKVIFYDYDELTRLTDMTFRRMPKPRDEDDEIASEPWYNVGAHDVFPEQFPTFLFPEGPARDVFMELHGDLADASFWNGKKQKLLAGVQEDIFPYEQEIRFGVRYGR